MVMIFYSMIMLEEKNVSLFWSLVLMYVVVRLRGKIMYKKPRIRCGITPYCVLCVWTIACRVQFCFERSFCSTVW